MKLNLFFSLSYLFLCSINSFGQQRESTYGDAVKADVKMKYVYSYEEAIQKAQKEKKLIFFNAFADWAIPCHSMNKVVFSNQKFADYMNTKFVNLFVDVTTKEGRPLAEKFGIRTFAQYLILDTNGNMVQRIMGGHTSEVLKEYVEIGANPKTSLQATETAYNSGDRSKKLLGDYSHALFVANDTEKFDQISKQYLGMLSPKEYSQKKNWIVVRNAIKDRNSEMYAFLITHRADFEKNIGTRVIDIYIQDLFAKDVYKYVSGETLYAANKMQQLHSEMQSVNISDTCNVGLMYRIGKLRGEKKYMELLDLLESDGAQLKTILPLIVFSLKFEDPTEALKKRLISYVRKLAETESGNVKMQLVQMANGLEFKSGIEFEEKLTFQQALDKAKRENKMIFVDCYTSWCGPCRMMASRVFTVFEVGQYFNEHFVNLKIDMEKGEGLELAKRYNIHVYPTMMVLEPSGKVAWRIKGTRQPKALIESVATVVDDLSKGYSVSKEAYDKGDRTIKTFTNYIAAMKESGELTNEQFDKMINDRFAGLTDEQFCSTATWPLLDIAVTNVSSSEFSKILSLHDALCEQNTADVVNKKIEKVIFPYAIGCLRQQVSQKEVMFFLSKIKEGSYPTNYTLNILADLIPMLNSAKVSEVLSFYEKRVTTLKDSKDRLNLDVLLPYFLKGADDAELASAEQYVLEALENGTSGAKNGYNNLLVVIKGLKQKTKNG